MTLQLHSRLAASLGFAAFLLAGTAVAADLRIVSSGGGMAALKAVAPEYERQTGTHLVIEPGPGRPAQLDSYADHRMVMVAAVLGLAIDGVTVADPGAVTKTLPDFRERWAGLLGEPIGASR